MLSGFSNELCSVIAAATPSSGRRRSEGDVTLRRQRDAEREGSAGDAGEIDDRSGASLPASSSLNLKQTPFGRQLRSLSGSKLQEAEASAEKAAAAAAAGGDVPVDTAGALASSALVEAPVMASLEGTSSGIRQPANVEAILAAGIQDISNSLVEDFSLNDMLRIILETMFLRHSFWWYPGIKNAKVNIIAAARLADAAVVKPPRR